MEPQLAQIFQRVFLHHQRAFRRRQPVIKARQEETQRRTARQKRQRFELRFAERPYRLITFQQRLALGDVVSAVLFEAPGVEADRHVISEQIVAGEIKIDQPGEFVAKKKDIVLKQIRMDHASRQILRPMGREIIDFGANFVFQALFHLVGAGLRLVPQHLPAFDGQRIRALDLKTLTGKMHGGQRLADFAAVFRFRFSQPHAFEEGNKRGGAARQLSQQRAILARQRQGAGQALGGQMLHEAEEEGQVIFLHPLFIKGQDQRIPGGVQQKIGVFYTLRNTLIRGEVADVILREETPQIIFGDVSINCQFKISS
ncbi:hypothetical protein AT6N2_C1678 [Agrobacterium tumefaciens]|nr:hypothetical protein AT6N2_C1678 [Agrobacterium tumefaciens]